MLGNGRHAHCMRSTGTKMSVGIAGKGVCRTTLGRLRSIINITGRSTYFPEHEDNCTGCSLQGLATGTMLELTMVMACM